MHLCCQIKHRYVVVGRLACVNTDVEPQKMIWNIGLVYSINTEMLHQLILWNKFVQNIASNQMFISGEISGISNIFVCTTMTKNNNVFLLKLLKLICS